MKERPILFSTTMVKAILEGRKTQTRRFVNPQPTFSENTGFHWKGYMYGIGSNYAETVSNFVNTSCPFGKVGDRLWVRESWYQKGTVGRSYPDDDEYQFFGHKQAAYVADGDAPKDWTFRKRPSIHMPRWACRLVLEITNIRVELLNDITEDDAVAEGMVADDDYCAEEYFSKLWNEINGWDKKGWNANPWVWVVEFKVIQGGVV